MIPIFLLSLPVTSCLLLLFVDFFWAVFDGTVSRLCCKGLQKIFSIQNQVEAKINYLGEKLFYI